MVGGDSSVSEISTRGAPNGDIEDKTGAACPVCEHVGRVFVAPFRWAATRHLNWSCRACGYAWVTLDRRGQTEPRLVPPD
jgi:hypothetical protein